MRDFSDFEKKAMKIMAMENPTAMNRQNFETLVSNLFYGYDVYFDVNLISNQVTIEFATEEVRDAIKINDIVDKLINLQILFEYLESLYWIRLYNKNADGGGITKNTKGKFVITEEIGDRQVNDFLCNNWVNFFCVTEAFKSFVKNDFKTQEQLNAEKTINEAIRTRKIANRTLIAAIITFAFSVVVYVFSLPKTESKPFNEKQMENSHLQIPVQSDKINNDSIKIPLSKE